MFFRMLNLKLLIISVLAGSVIYISFQPTAFAACKKGADAPRCIDWKIAPNGKYVEVENNCSQGYRVHIDKRGRFCPDKDVYLGSGYSWSDDTSKCRFVYVRLCR